MIDNRSRPAVVALSSEPGPSLVEQLPIPMWQGDLDGVCRYFNPAWLSYTGRTLDEALAEGRVHGIHPEDRDRCTEQLARGRAEGRSFELAYRRRRHDGAYRQVVEHIAPLRDAAGALAGLTGQCIDIHDHRRDGHAAEETDELRFLADLLPQMIFTTTPDGRNDFSNRFAAEFIGTTSEDLLGDRWVSSIHPEERGDLAERWARCLVTGEPFEMLYRIRRAADDQYRWFLGRAAPLRGADGRIVKWFGLNTDLHDQKLAEMERIELLAREQKARADAEAANRLKDEFLATLSHELRTPLSAILGWVQLLRTENLTEAQRAHALETIDANAKLQNQLVADILDVSRIITGKLRLEVKWLDLERVVHAAIETLLPASIAKGITVDVNVDPKLGSVRGDPERLQQVMWNLLSNAIKFCPRGGHVVVSLAPIDNEVEIVVTDDGEGIPADMLPHIFERFRQGDNSTRRRHGGLGLGLAIVRHLVELHGGTVEAYSGGTGQGTTFRIQFPKLAIQNPEPPREAAKQEAPPVDLAGLHVVVLDDDEPTREILRVFLEVRGARVSSVASVAEAIRMVKSDRPDAVISDISMPDQDGYDLVRELRAVNRDEPPIPALALTAHARAEEQHRTLSAGFHAHMTKPVDMKELITVVARLCGRR